MNLVVENEVGDPSTWTKGLVTEISWSSAKTNDSSTYYNLVLLEHYIYFQCKLRMIKKSLINNLSPDAQGAQEEGYFDSYKKGNTCNNNIQGE